MGYAWVASSDSVTIKSPLGGQNWDRNGYLYLLNSAVFYLQINLVALVYIDWNFYSTKYKQDLLFVNHQ